MPDQNQTTEKDDFDQAFDTDPTNSPGSAGAPDADAEAKAKAEAEAKAAADAKAAEDKTAADKAAAEKAAADAAAAGGQPGDVIDWKARFDELQHSTDSWNGRLKASALREKELQAQLERLNADLAAAKKPPEPPDDPDSDPALKKALEEYPDVMGPVVSRLKAISDKLRSAEDRLEKAANTAPLQPRVDQLEIEAHMKRITDVHPDAIPIAESKEFGEWINGRPAHLRKAYQDIFQAGTSDQIVGMLTDYKSSRDNGAAAKAAAEKAAAAKAAEEKKRQEQLKAAGAVRASGGAPPPAAPNPDDFDAGWNESP